MMFDIWTQKKTLDNLQLLIGGQICARTVKHMFEAVINAKLSTDVLLMPIVFCSNFPIPSTPWEILSADHIICLPETRNGNTNMLVQIDHSTRCVIATPSASLAAHTVTDALYHNIILIYGPPNMYLSDGGTAFTARHTQRFLQKYGITQSTTLPYSPQANSIVERANGIIVSSLKKND
ncbi:uncharacterized protein LOC129959276 [Argiope bruennichi]|uniref:uncharacterized protein LOC129959276 n=1 Tax=Argiope bruennichi TaxID=94029 RepID=UPI002493F548|nr:uncharacterized protein LOC129959276 [Argiope bruennichi]